MVKVNLELAEQPLSYTQTADNKAQGLLENESVYMFAVGAFPTTLKFEPTGAVSKTW